MTFKADDDLQIKPEGMLTSSPTGRQLKTNLLYTDLENVKILGRGATSKVFLSKHKPSGAMYAVKELNAMADDDTRRMACNELRIAHKHASHAEHLVHFFDAFFANDKICIAMEFRDAGCTRTSSNARAAKACRVTRWARSCTSWCRPAVPSPRGEAGPPRPQAGQCYAHSPWRCQALRLWHQ